MGNIAYKTRFKNVLLEKQKLTNGVNSSLIAKSIQKWNELPRDQQKPTNSLTLKQKKALCRKIAVVDAN